MVIGSHFFILDKKYIQPMAIYEQKPGDRQKLAEVAAQNKLMKEGIIQRMVAQQNLVEGIFEELPELNDTLAKHILTNSAGQHKDEKNALKLGAKKPAELPEGEEYEIIDEPIKY